MNRKARKLAKRVAKNYPRGNVKRTLREWIIPPRFLDLLVKARVAVSKRNHKSEDIRLSVRSRPSTVHFLRFGLGKEFVVDFANIRSPVGFAYTIEQHQYRRYLSDSPEKRLDALRGFYTVFQPNSLAALHFVPDDSTKSNSERGSERTTWFDNPNGGPWNLNQMSPFMGLPWDPAPTKRVKCRKQGTQFFGPYPKEKILREAIRLDNLVASIEKFGYKPDLFDGAIRGYLLTRHHRGERQAIFRPLEGEHRLATLKHLGMSSVEVNFDSRRPREYRLEDVNEFAGVKDGRFTVDQAEILFHSFFRNPNQVLITY